MVFITAPSNFVFFFLFYFLSDANLLLLLSVLGSAVKTFFYCDD